MTKDDFLSINKVSNIVGVSDHTITRWYKWWEDDRFSKPEDMHLPQYYHMDRRLTKFFRVEDIHYLKTFKEQMQTSHRGVMATFNAEYQWGARGIHALRNKDLLDEKTGRVKEIN